MKTYKLGIIGGCGFMAKALIKGFLSSKVILSEQIIISDKRLLSAEKNIKATTDNLFVAQNSEFVLFAVKPQNFAEVLREVEPAGIKKAISIMAGIKKEKFGGIKVVRCMPNLPASTGKGVTAIDSADFIGKDNKFVFSLFESVGRTIEMDESKMDAVTAISGSGPAYIFLFAKLLAEAGAKIGLTNAESDFLMRETFAGAAKMISDGVNLWDMIKAVTSKGGTTEAALNVFEKEKLILTVEQAVKAARDRSKELSESVE